jgi:hypothetical protein
MGGMESVINNRKAAKRMAANAYKTIKRKHGMKNLKLYERMLEHFK